MKGIIIEAIVIHRIGVEQKVIVDIVVVFVWSNSGVVVVVVGVVLVVVVVVVVVVLMNVFDIDRSGLSAVVPMENPANESGARSRRNGGILVRGKQIIADGRSEVDLLEGEGDARILLMENDGVFQDFLDVWLECNGALRRETNKGIFGRPVGARINTDLFDLVHDIHKNINYMHIRSLDTEVVCKKRDCIQNFQFVGRRKKILLKFQKKK